MDTGVKIALVDVGLGNILSVERAFHAAAGRLPLELVRTRDPDEVRVSDGVVVPGQGAFGDFSAALRGGLGDALRERIDAGRPYFGICLGLQLLLTDSEESPGSAGLGVFPGRVRRLHHVGASGERLCIPHMGWNTVRRSVPSAVLDETETHYYFVHSYVADPEDPSIVVGTTEYGVSFVSAVERGPLFACQFHPEKSQHAGLTVLRRYLERL